MSFLFNDVDLEEKFEEVMEGSTEFIKRSNIIVNKDKPLLYLRSMIRDEVFANDFN